MSKIECLKETLINLIEAEPFIQKIDIISGKYGVNSEYKNGIYFLYDKDEQVVYIGKVGNGKSTSLYSRLTGHGSGSHKVEYWWKEIVKCKFKSFQDLTNRELNQIERLAINKKGPKFNDVKINDSEAEIIINKIAPLSSDN
ncbi:hypothetical protein JN09_001145 [Acholeplasma morum]|uniref:GIY-YIG nuclease family protein n=1 Tax=Paracholeplasma morum TaxID=264637 RepID=UPI00195C3DB2|nr:GIY-YIG nuclease family protein [Paracholeplasma morum]MBM7453812.1 hypothetical protein [Paracholeplasma morum]